MRELITDDGVVLDLLPATVIPLSFLSPIFNPRGSHSQGFDIANTPNNRKAFGWPNKIESVSLKLSLRITVKLFGEVIMRPLLTVKGFDGSIRGWMAEDEGEFYVKANGKNIRDDFEYEVGTYSAVDYKSYLDASTIKRYPASNFAVFPVLNQDFYKDTPYYAVSGSETYLHNAYQNYYKGIVPFGFDPANSLMITPFPYLCYVLDSLMNQLGYWIEKNAFFDDEELRSLVLFSITATWRFNPHLPNQIHVHSLKDGVPDMDILEFIDNLETGFNVTTFFDNLKSKVRILSNDEIIRSIEYIDITHKVSTNLAFDVAAAKDGFLLKFISDDNDDTWKDLWNNIHDDDITIADAIADYATLLTKNDAVNVVRLVENENWYYRRQINETTFLPEWSYYSRNIQWYKEGEGEYEVETAFTPLISIPDHGDIHESSRVWSTPKVRMQGNDPSFYQGMKGREVGLRLMFYRGLVQDGNGNNYPLGSEDCVDANGDAIPGASKSLRYDGDAGLYVNCWKSFLEWKTNINKLAKVNVDFTATDLANRDFSKKYRIDGKNYLLNKIDVDLLDKGLGVSKLESYLV